MNTNAVKYLGIEPRLSCLWYP